MYTTIAKILESGISKAEFINLLNDENRDPEAVDFDDEDDPLIIRATGKIKKGDDLIDAHLRGRFTLPLTSVPGTIENLSTDFAIYYCFEHRHRQSMPEDLQIKMKEDLKLLAGIQKGDVNPGIEPIDKRADTIIKAEPSTGKKVFGDDTFKDGTW